MIPIVKEKFTETLAMARQLDALSRRCPEGPWRSILGEAAALFLDVARLLDQRVSSQISVEEVQK